MPRFQNSSLPRRNCETNAEPFAVVSSPPLVPSSGFPTPRETIEAELFRVNRYNAPIASIHFIAVLPLAILVQAANLRRLGVQKRITPKMYTHRFRAAVVSSRAGYSREAVAQSSLS